MNGDIDVDPFDPVAGDSPVPVRFPWPPPPDTPALEAIIETASAVLTRPARFFAAMPTDAPVAAAVAFLLVLTYAGAGVHLFWEMVLPDPAWIPAVLRATDGEAVVSFFLAGPFSLAVTTLVALLVHFGLVVFGARREPARSTVAVLYYASATAILQVVPWLGTLLAGLASMVITIIGVREVHGTSTGRAAAAVLLPLFAVTALLVGGVMVLVIVGLMSGVLSR